MNLYVDTSVLLRVVLGERGRVREWTRSERWVSSELVRLESLRTIDRARVQLRDRYPDLVLGTHDEELAIAARAMGFEVVGVATG